MNRQTIAIDETLDAPVDHVFAAFADHRWFTRLFGAPCRRIREGAPEPDGLGSVRRIGIGPLGLDETIVAFETNRRIDYQISRGGGPIREHLGQLRFEDLGDRTRVRYTVKLGSPLPGVARAVAAALRLAWAAHAPRRLRALTQR